MKPAGSPALLVFTAALAAALPARAAAPTLPSPVAAPSVVPATDVRLVTLRNGMRLLLAPDSAARALDVAVWYRAGTVHEREGATGISHLFEHLMFGGSAHYPPQEHSRLVQAEGGTANAYTTPDYACYYQTVPPGALDLVLQLEADRIGALELSTAALESEKRVVREERRWRAEGAPGGRALEALDRLAWPGHPYRWPVIGLEPDLDRIGLADCQAYYADHYAPNNALVTVVGRFDPDLALRSAERWLEPLQRRRVAADAAPPAPAQTAARRGWERMGVPFGMVLAGWKVPARPDPDDAAFGLLSRVLTSGPAARLQRALTAEPLRCLAVQGGLESRRDGGLIYVAATVRPGADSAAVEAALVGEVERLAREPLGEEELERVRRQEQIGTLLAWQTARGTAEALGAAQMLDGDWRAAALRLERVRRISAADLQRAAARVLTATGRNLLWIAPTRAPAGAPAGGSEGGPGPGAPPAEGGR